MKSDSTSIQTVFVVDDDDHVRESLCGVIQTKGVPVQGFASAAEFRRRFRPHWCGCLVLDVQMPRQTGLDLYQELLGEGRRWPVIFISGQADVNTAVAAMKTGAIEFLEKPVDPTTLLDRIEKALVLDAQWRRHECELAGIQERMAKLTARDLETLQLLLAGETNKSMAAKLFISQRAVEMRRATIMRKLGVRSIAELLNVALTHRILDDLRSAKQDTSIRFD